MRKDSGTSRDTMTVRSRGARRDSMAAGRRSSRGGGGGDPSYDMFWANFNYVDVTGGETSTVGDKVYGHNTRRKRRQSTIRKLPPAAVNIMSFKSKSARKYSTSQRGCHCIIIVI